MEQFQILRVSKLKIKTHTQNNNKILNIALEKLHTTAAKSKSSRSQELLFRKTSRSQELLMAIPKSERDWNGVVRVSEWSREDRERRVAVAGDGASPPVESPPPESERRRDGLPLPEGDGVSLQTGPTCQCPPQPSSRFSLSPSLSYGFYGFTPPLSSLSLSPPSAARRRHLRRRRRHSRGRSRQRPRRRALSSRGSAVPSASLERLRSFHAKSSGGFLLIVTRFSLAVFVWVSQDLIINVLVHHVWNWKLHSD